MKKAKLFPAIATLVLFIALVGFGVYAAANTTASSSGRIGFVTNNLSATVACYKGTDLTGTADKTVTYTANGAPDETTPNTAVTDTWAVTGLEFATNTPGSATSSAASIGAITLSFVVTNTSEKTIYAYFTGSVAANSSIITSDTLDGTRTSGGNLINEDIVSVALSGVTSIAPSASQTLTIVFTIQDYEFQYHDTTEAFAYYLNLNSSNPTPPVSP